MIVSLRTKPGSGRLTSHGKQLVAASMYSKGRGFLGASALLHQTKGYDYVVLHLFCQGTEILLKALLLQRNYDQYQPKLRAFGHNIELLAGAASLEFGLKQPSGALREELVALSSLYSGHRLRYGTFYDVLVDPTTIPCSRVARRLLAAMRLTARHASRTAA